MFIYNIKLSILFQFDELLKKKFGEGYLFY